MMSEKAKGYSYFVGREQIEQYKAWPVIRRLAWLLEGNKLRKNLPRKTVAIQDAFRQGKF
jgi:hypothetical protein